MLREESKLAARNSSLRIWKAEKKLLSEEVSPEQPVDEVLDVRSTPGSKGWNSGISQSRG